MNDVKAGEVLKTPTAIFGTSLFNGLYIRQEYLDLHDIIKQRLTSDSSLRRILVVGSPGIGKSVFGVFLLLLFMMEQKDVAYRPLGGEGLYFTHSTDGYKCSRMPHAEKTYDGVFDGNEAGAALSLTLFAHAFLFASPSTTNYNHFVKDMCFKVYMNPWTKDECQQFADVMGLEDQDEWLRRFNLVGGKPRFVFSSSQTFDDLVEQVKETVPHNVDQLKDQVRLFEQKVFDDRMKHIAFHLYRNENAPSRAYLTYSSLAVEAIMSTRYQVRSADQIRSLLQTPASNLQSWRGKEIEKFMLQELATSKFCMRGLEGNRVETETQHGPFTATSKIIQAPSEIQNELVLYIPLSKTFPAIDGVLVVPEARRIIYAQSTVSKAHPIKYQQLEDVCMHLSQRQEFRSYTHILLFIVSNEIYDGFTVQPYKNADGKNRTEKTKIPMTQYVGKIIEP
ncbi:unnamed protein product [Phytophthora fragariaefolia]|uniref:Unnamed protein product n=1 Tax=Phytophthora fragariaefolia TaxID=1490495 RepID=A0A9W6UBD4_9STRA|nr:unnamed protein product [Phytophthora fragariaefolia]